MAVVATQMGLGEQVKARTTSHILLHFRRSTALTVAVRQVASDGFIKQMMLEIETLASAAKGAATTDAEPDGQVSYDEFIAWFHETGVTYLDKPQYEASVNLEKPSDEELKAMFRKIDADGSGSIDLGKTQTLSPPCAAGTQSPTDHNGIAVRTGEVQEALRVIWPYMDASGFQRAFAAADEDCSGAEEMEEFDEVVKFTVWLNENRHTIQELEDAFGETVGEDEFCFGYKTLFDVHAYGGARPPSRPLLPSAG